MTTTAPVAEHPHGIWEPPSAVRRLQLISNAESVAIVGASNKPSRSSHFVATYLLSSSTFRVYFINPTVDEILGHPVYDSLQDLPESPDIVDIFRKPADVPSIVDDAVAVGAKTIWMQLGIENTEAAQQAKDAGLEAVQNRCLKIEHARFHGGLHLAGFNTGVISSARQKLDI
ncbi:CoA-binding protein [Nesterenkonia aerolata]|uniref:CoA-binding protein n=1 Tax=Nesterenkonia aerolata TaxID=3074079 RepID=A0ABU2DR92_9MICC|nr:CoA-binding protein [Nesterenkonia sp. LY-0111]MDR8018998.1 CoA-binding protein [Nesterenkonia sp. LY-0111]